MRIINKIKLRIKNHKLNKQTNSENSLSLVVDKLTKLEGHNRIYTTILNDCEIGFGTYRLAGPPLLKTRIGRYCSISTNLQLVLGNHPRHTHVSTHPVFYGKEDFTGLNYNVDYDYKKFKYVDGFEDRLLVIGHDVWIGSDVKIMNGIKVGDGAIIGAGAVVVKDVPPFAIVGGVPAKIIKYRFSEEDIKYLLELKWWEKDIAWIKDNAKYFNDVKELKKHV